MARSLTTLRTPADAGSLARYLHRIGRALPAQARPGTTILRAPDGPTTASWPFRWHALLTRADNIARAAGHSWLAEADRGRPQQQAALANRASRASWGESPHNWHDDLGSFALDLYLVSGRELLPFPDLEPLAHDLGFRRIDGDYPHIEQPHWPLALRDHLCAP